MTDAHDQEALQRLRQLDPGGTLFRKWIRKFLFDAPGKLAAIETALQAEKLEAVIHEAHSLKSMAGWLGGRRLMILCEQLERDARGGDVEACRLHVPALERQLPLFRDWLTGCLETEAQRTDFAGGEAADQRV